MNTYIYIPAYDGIYIYKCKRMFIDMYFVYVKQTCFYEDFINTVHNKYCNTKKSEFLVD